MISLNGVALSPDLAWNERYASWGVAQTSKRTLGGRLSLGAAPLVGGRPVTLVASEDSGWLTKDMVDFLLAAASTPSMVLSLTFHNDLINVPVVFRHHEGVAVELRPLTPKSNPLPGDYFVGTINLMMV